MVGSFDISVLILQTQVSVAVAANTTPVDTNLAHIEKCTRHAQEILEANKEERKSLSVETCCKSTMTSSVLMASFGALSSV
jgi:hypothetical protein